MIIDIITVILVALGFYSGYSRGLINTVFDTLSLLIALLFALKLSPFVISLVESMFNMAPAINFIIGFVLTFVVVMFAVRLIGKQLEKLLNVIKLGILNKIAGGILLAVFYALLFSLVLWFLSEANIISEPQKEKSVSYKMLEPLPEQGKTLFVKLKPLFTEFWEKVVEMVDNVKEETDKIELKSEINE